jgi:hypothetical protein
MRHLARLVMLATLVTCTVLLALSCATITPAPAVSQVSITTKPEDVRGCTFVGDLKGAYQWSAGLEQGAGTAAESDAIREVKQRATAMGADTVLLVASTTGNSGSALRGDAYRCSRATPNR